MTCPRCVQKVAPGVENCPHCGFSLAAACALYGEDPVAAGLLRDGGGWLGDRERIRVLAALEDLRRRVPPFFLMVWLDRLPIPQDPRLFAFWLLNQAVVTLPEPEACTLWNARGFLLVVDPDGGTAVLTAGYFAESVVIQTELDGVLGPVSPIFGNGKTADAVLKVVEGLESLLGRNSGMPEGFGKSGDTVPSPGGGGMEIPAAPGETVIPLPLAPQRSGGDALELELHEKTPDAGEAAAPAGKPPSRKQRRDFRVKKGGIWKAGLKKGVHTEEFPAGEGTGTPAEPPAPGRAGGGRKRKEGTTGGSAVKKNRRGR